MLAKRTFKNQVTIPKEVIDQVGDAEYFDVLYRDGEIILTPVEILAQGERLSRVRKKIKALGLTETHVEDAVRWARKS